MMTNKRERSDALKRLRELLRPGDTVHTILRHVSRSGMSRAISCVIIGNDRGAREPFDISYLVARVLGESLDRTRGGVKVSGCGMDMGFALVYDLSMNLYPTYICRGDGNGNHANRCPSNEPVNPGPERDNYNRRRKHRDGYAISHRWQ